MLKKKWFWMVVAALVAVAVAAWFFGGGDGSDETTPVFTVAEGPLTIGITASGSVQSRDKVVLRSELEGRNTIIWVVEDGVSVKKGDLLMEFDVEAIKAEGYDVITPVVICNSADYTTFKTFVDKTVATGDVVIELSK